MDNVTLVGPKQLDSNSSCTPSSTVLSPPAQHTFACSATTKVSSMDGRTGAVGTKKPTSYFSASMPYSNLSMIVSVSTSVTLPVQITLQMDLHEEYSPHIPFSYRPSPYQETCASSFVTPACPQQKENSWDIVNAQLTMRLSSRMSTTAGSGEDHCWSFGTHGMTSMSRFATMAPIAIAETTACPRPYDTSLTPLPSALRPHCLARDQLHLWLPHITRS